MKYSFGDEKSPIQELEIVKPAKEAGAIFFTPENMTAEAAAEIKQNMVQNGYKVIAGEHEGKPVLKVSGFDSANNLLATIADDGAVKGDFTSQKTTFDEVKVDKSDKSKLALFGAGACFAVASSAILAAGAIRQNAGETFQGFAGIVPAIGLMWSSQQTPESQMSYLYRDFKEFAQENNLRIGNDVRAILTEREAPDDLFHNFQRGVFENGPAANNLIKAIAISSGTIGAAQQGNWYKTAGNAIAVTGLLTANALPEQHAEHKTSVHLGVEQGKKAGEVSEPPTAKKGFVSGLVAKIQESPQMLAGGLALVQQGLKAVGNELYDKSQQQEFDKSYPELKRQYTDSFNTATNNPTDALEYGKKLEKLESKKIESDRKANAMVADQISMVGYGLGYALYMGTKKHNGSKLDLDPIIEICANMVHDYHTDQQKAVIQRLATFLGNHQYASENVDDIVSKINHKMAVLADSPWVVNNADAANEIKPFNNFATRLDGAKQEQVEATWNQNAPSTSVIETKLSEKLVAGEKQAAMNI